VDQKESKKASVGYENALIGLLKKAKVAFLTEDEQKERAFKQHKPLMSTPDVLIDERNQLIINGKRISWLDGKNFYCPSKATDAFFNEKMEIQAKKYWNQFGPGAFVFAQGYAAEALNAFKECHCYILDGRELAFTAIIVKSTCNSSSITSLPSTKLEISTDTKRTRRILVSPEREISTDTPISSPKSTTGDTKTTTSTLSSPKSAISTDTKRTISSPKPESSMDTSRATPTLSPTPEISTDTKTTTPVDVRKKRKEPPQAHTTSNAQIKKTVGDEKRIWDLPKQTKQKEGTVLIISI